MEQNSLMLRQYVLRHAENNLISSHRLSQWGTFAPELEIEMALMNMSLDQLGQARLLLAYVCDLENKGRTEDDMAFYRDSREWQNFQLVEQPNGSFSDTIARMVYYDGYNHLLYHSWLGSSDTTLKSIAQKAIKETEYHQKFSKEWVIRLGDGTHESHTRMQNSLNDLWRWTGEMFAADAVDDHMLEQGIAPHLPTLKQQWLEDLDSVLSVATLTRPTVEDTFYVMGAKQGLHTEHFGYILAEMQSVPRAMPNCQW